MRLLVCGGGGLLDAEVRAEGLTPGEPFGLLGSSSLLWRDTAPSRGQ